MAASTPKEPTATNYERLMNQKPSDGGSSGGGSSNTSNTNSDSTDSNANNSSEAPKAASETAAAPINQSRLIATEEIEQKIEVAADKKLGIENLLSYIESKVNAFANMLGLDDIERNNIKVSVAAATRKPEDLASQIEQQAKNVVGAERLAVLAQQAAPSISSLAMQDFVLKTGVNFGLQSDIPNPKQADAVTKFSFS